MAHRFGDLRAAAHAGGTAIRLLRVLAVAGANGPTPGCTTPAGWAQGSTTVPRPRPPKVLPVKPCPGGPPRDDGQPGRGYTRRGPCARSSVSSVGGDLRRGDHRPLRRDRAGADRERGRPWRARSVPYPSRGRASPATLTCPIVHL